MSVLTKNIISKFKGLSEHILDVGTLAEKTNARNILDLIDTITDRDGTIETLQAKLEKAVNLIKGHTAHGHGNKTLKMTCCCKWCEALKEIKEVREC